MRQPPANSTTRFSNRVENYVRFRPRYPVEVLSILSEETNLDANAVIADIGSGTGISAELFLRNGNSVFGVEPNADMRQAAEQLLQQYENFHSVAATAEATTLANASVNYVVAAQAFHWFNVAKVRPEFARILRPGGWVVLMWNSRRMDTTPFLRDYEALLQKFGTDYCESGHRNVDTDKLRALYQDGSFSQRRLINEQQFDFDGLLGRVLSSSYMPTAEHPKYAAMIDELKRLYQEHATDRQVCIEYDTEIYFGHVA